MSRKSAAEPQGGRNINRRLLYTLLSSADVVDAASDMYKPEGLSWYRTLLGHSFCPGSSEVSNNTTNSTLSTLKAWLQIHEEAKVMFASALVAFALWWLVRTMVTFFLNLICPILIVLLAVICIPQLRAPLLGQNYPVVANVVRNILLKMADNIKI